MVRTLKNKLEFKCQIGPSTDRTKAEDRMESGTFVGFRMKSGEYILIASGEAITARTFRRRLVSERWANREDVVRPSTAARSARLF